MEAPASDCKPRARKVRAPQPPLPVNPVTPAQAQAATDLRRADRHAEPTRRQAAEPAQLAALPVQQAHAAGIDVGDASHWVCVEATPDGSEAVREFPAHTPGLRQLVAWLGPCAVTSVALEATGSGRR